MVIILSFSMLGFFTFLTSSKSMITIFSQSMYYMWFIFHIYVLYISWNISAQYHKLSSCINHRFFSYMFLYTNKKTLCINCVVNVQYEMPAHVTFNLFIISIIMMVIIQYVVKVFLAGNCYALPLSYWGLDSFVSNGINLLLTTVTLCIVFYVVSFL